MAGIPSIGDVLLLSQLAWRIGCAFTSSRSSAPPEFHEVENDLKTLTKSLDILAETLDDDNSILTGADDKVKAGVNKVLVCCQQTLEDLNSFVTRYQEVKRPENGLSGNTVRSWKPILVKNYKSVWWTAEGGSLQVLHNILHMHVNSINLTMKALQSGSLSRLANTVEPMAVQLDEVHNLVVGDMNEKIVDIYNLMMTMAGQLDAESRSPNQSPRVIGTKVTGKVSHEDLSSGSSHTRPMSADSIGSVRQEAVKYSLDVPQKQKYNQEDLRISVPSSSRSYPGTTRSEGDFSPLRSPTVKRVSEHLEYELAASQPMTVKPQKQPIKNSVYGEALPYPGPCWKQHPHQTWDASNFPKPLLETASSTQASSEYSLHNEPFTVDSSAAVASEVPFEYEPQSPLQAVHNVSYIPDIQPMVTKLSRSMTTVSQQETFKKELFRDTAILCEVSGSCVEYAQPDPDSETGENMMVQACSDCQIMLVRKKDPQRDGSTRYITSIWALSDDRSVRMQQKLADGEEVVPYTVWGATEKVSLRNFSILKFHGTTYYGKEVDTAKTNWVNYVFKDSEGANQFQSALMGKTLILSVRTNKTLRIHDGLVAGTFAYQEQMCALENLRLWRDPDSQGVLAMIHYTPQFREGYMAFYLNSQRDRVRISDGGDKVIKLKGLNIPLEKTKGRRPSHAPTTVESMDVSMMVSESSVKNGGSDRGQHGGKKEKKVSGARLEFTTEDDKRRFLEKFREAQGFFYPG